MKNKITFLSILIISWLLPLGVKAQGRITYALTFSPTWHHRDITIKPSALQNPSNPAVGSHQGYSIGLTTNYAFTAKWSISAGLLFNNSSGSFYLGPAESYSEKFRRFQLPLLVNYIPSTRRLSPYISAGLLLDYAYYVKRMTVQGARPGFVYEENIKLDDLSAIKPYVMLGLGVKYQVMPKLTIIVQPVAAYSVQKVSDHVSSDHEYQLGIQTQIKFSF
ncbi:PorT family protein [Spirosoma agri]|uniref:PorT family protein n=1 Tax=Spirosoma agri TaxID=1987381 RepID=A0A6M0IQK5_9BACT|nr:outer membrane beta-barrel protein [Spirosoma agri]NEU70232.1 PorT family protein [Spirosoma agri]